ncbi:MAG: TetM/TetW/TetO/TetS family tetracycline resistance ribosomal protection protein [Lachnospiraceae bacterium]|nr:TetM/TetW/TetO/TetS family tetracycline resistance ribosomal protection protein [Lachnospiraceae bacterium]
MGEQLEEKRTTKHICAGLLAHVDAGKTTLSEAMLYLSGSTRKLGRVDHRDAFLDTYELERDRGITIFSKQAVFDLGDCRITLLDTPGHVDFSAEMERTLQVLDYAVLVINGADGIQGHTRTLWKLLEHYQIPTFLFVNKMDQEGTDRERLLRQLQNQLSETCYDFGTMEDGEELFSEEMQECFAMCEEALMEKYLAGACIKQQDIRRLIRERKVFPCYFGSALKLDGVERFLQGLKAWMEPPVYSDTFGAKVFKVVRDETNTRLTYLKVTGGSLKVKSMLSNSSEHLSDLTETWEEKVDQIRIYSGARFLTVPEAEAGTVCAVTGLTRTYPGEGLGAEQISEAPVLTPVLSYRIELPQGADVQQMLIKLRQLEEEEPELHVIWNEKLQEIHAQVMGEIQIEILKSLIQERFGIEVVFGKGNIVYRETITKPVEGVGHFEPLRHYAEVHLLLEPGKPGSGIVLESSCSEDVLDRNWQRLILTHLEEREHPGVLGGFPITDMKITLLTGRAHLKHTEGGDFRQATYRAVRQGLRRTESKLLEPWYAYRLELPSEMTGHALADIQRMEGTFDPPIMQEQDTIITGKAPVATMQHYQTEVAAYTRGQGHLSCTLDGYERCHNEQEVLEELGYDPEQDTENPTGSVFCAHGAGYNVPWDEVEQHMHLEYVWKPKTVPQSVTDKKTERVTEQVSWKQQQADSWKAEKELQEIFNRTFRNTPKNRENSDTPVRSLPGKKQTDDTSYSYNRNSLSAKKKDSQEYLLVDGYNIIFAWEELSELARVNIQAARDRLMDILTDYQGYRKCTLILVFDAYKVVGGVGEVQKYHNIYVVYTKESETADQYIEKTVHKMGRKYSVTVATSDALEQVIILGQGGQRLSAQGLKEEILLAAAEVREQYLNKSEPGQKHYLFDSLTEELAREMEELRLGRRI